jgi:hypothetical protein
MIDFFLAVFIGTVLYYWISTRHGVSIGNFFRIILIPFWLLRQLWITYSKWMDDVLK